MRLVFIQYSSDSVCNDVRKKFVNNIEQADEAIIGNFFLGLSFFWYFDLRETFIE